ncbi:MAG: hypothetical protein KAX49_08315 [Halanaerobiales bacterium]|nr:hypothetical protein [Halanaerobiales bacterium]
MQGKALADVANDFVDNLQRELLMINQRDRRLQVLLSGREVIIQANKNKFRKEKHVLYVLPYNIDKNEGYIDDNDLLEEDQRDKWWSNYGKVKGHEYDGLPDKLKTMDLDEITAQPLLNYLVALSFERGEIDFSTDINLNEIYYDLLKEVYNRSYEKTHTTVKNIELEQFTRILEKLKREIWLLIRNLSLPIKVLASI